MSKNSKKKSNMNKSAKPKTVKNFVNDSGDIGVAAVKSAQAVATAAVNAIGATAGSTATAAVGAVGTAAGATAVTAVEVARTTAGAVISSVTGLVKDTLDEVSNKKKSK